MPHNSSALTHAQIEAGFHQSLWIPQTPDGLGAGSDNDRRFAVYRNNVQTALTRALGQRFLVVERLVGSEFFTAMARVFAQAHPPSNPVLLDWGQEFPAFLEGFPPVANLPYLPDVARIELARGRAYHAADHQPVDPAALAVADPTPLRFRFAPSVQAFVSSFPAVSIWAMNQPGAQKRPLPAGSEYALIARGQDLEAMTVPLEAPAHAMLTALMGGATLGEAATHMPDPTPLLTLLLSHGLITDIEGDIT